MGGDGKKSMELDVKIVLKSRRFGEFKLIVRQSPVTNVTGKNRTFTLLQRVEEGETSRDTGAILFID